MEMATKSIVRYIFTILFVSVICCNCQSNKNPKTNNPGGSSSWAKLQISADTLSSMNYGNFLIEIYEHANNHKQTTTASQKKYFYAPIALLDHTSAVSSYNNVTKQLEMRFRVEMWNDKVQNEVVKHLNDIVGHEIKSNRVTVIPLEKVILANKIPTTDYSPSPVWTNYDKSKTIWFYMSCNDRKICDELANQMRSNPNQFDHLKLLYSLSSQTSQTKQTTIRIDSLTSGQMVSTLLQKFENKNEIFLTASDEKKMLTETATNIRMDTFDDYEVGSPDTELQISNILKGMLVTSKATITKQSDKMWDSVFWNDDNYRPDKTTKTLNEIFNKLDRETQKKLADMFQKAEKQSVLIDTFSSSNKDEERKGEEQIRRENQSKDANENERRRSEATDQGQSSRNKSKDDKSLTVNADGEANVQGKVGLPIKIPFLPKIDLSGGGKIVVDYNNTHNTEQENEKTGRAKTNSDEYGRKLENKEKIQHNFDLSSWADVDRISSTMSGKMAKDSDRSRRVEISKEEMAKLLQESKNHVQWDGEKFVPKPMQLSRINLAKFRDSQSFQDRNDRVRYTTAELSAPIKIMEHAELTVTDEWNNLKDEFKETQKELVKTRADLTKNLDGLSSKLKDCVANSDRLGQELKVAETNLKKDLRATSTDLETTKTNLASTRTELGSTKSAVADLVTKLNARTSEIVDIGRMPTSCADLQRTGHKLSGFFSVKGSKKMEMIYCNFYSNQNDKQKWIGYADVKSEPVHFYVQRNSSFYNESTPIPYNLAVVNEGNAMNLTSGIFTAPRPGIYFFSFAGVARLKDSSDVYFYSRLYLNGNRIGSSHIREDNGPVDQHSVVTLQSTLNLKKGDQLWVQISYSGSSSYLYEANSFRMWNWVGNLIFNPNYLTHFTGLMLEEEIAASL
ncbi:uncharacterized protein LOC124204007 isoform X2 [Daphnia pulex]|uniref:uncharacterized protein LOC124204007 isoform X2 n=1 Tax=Daphnia pulex TaxID=6669 RepID=UPI001EDD8247|nr:uncharacterized protein LOC124204007 isoform X2 [Daphnia pulex]